MLLSVTSSSNQILRIPTSSGSSHRRRGCLVSRILFKLKQVQPSAQGVGRTIFLASATIDLEPRRASIRSELAGRGHTVLPTEPLSESGPELKIEVEAHLAKADLSVHLIGRTYGLIPDEETRSFGEIQYDSACAQRARPGFHQLVWIPEDLESPTERQQVFLKKVRENVDVSASGKRAVFETSFESFKEGL